MLISNFVQFIATTGSAASDQQALHGQTINHAQQQPMGHIQGAGKRH